MDYAWLAMLNIKYDGGVISGGRYFDWRASVLTQAYDSAEQHRGYVEYSQNDLNDAFCGYESQKQQQRSCPVAGVLTHRTSAIVSSLSDHINDLTTHQRLHRVVLKQVFQNGGLCMKRR